MKADDMKYITDRKGVKLDPRERIRVENRILKIGSEIGIQENDVETGGVCLCDCT